jgi:hypothetical protein
VGDLGEPGVLEDLPGADVQAAAAEALADDEAGTAQTPGSSLSSPRPFHGIREVRSFGKAIRGSTATQPAGSPAT